jgi:hypothetical protein
MSANSAAAPAFDGGLSRSVGRNSANLSDDVLAVQILLNKAGAGIQENGSCDRATISAIEEYQRNWTRHPDGRVDPGGKTWQHLIAGELKIERQGYKQLPQSSVFGYYSYASMDRQFGTPQTIDALTRISQKFSQQNPGFQVGIGDISLANGAVMSPHQTHRNGRNADIRPVRKDGKKLPVTIHDAQYSRELTRALVEILRSDANFKSVLFNDTQIQGVKPFADHDDHLHVSMKE